jgi:gamma-polyglutamate biosynthesis protein CapA
MKKSSPKIWIAIFFLALIVAIAYFCSRSVSKNSSTPLVAGKPTISTIIVPHHDLVKDKRAEFFASIKDKTNPKTIVLASTNHFQTGSCNIETTDQDWDLSDSKISAEKTIITKLVEEKIACNENSAFEREHGIKNILADIENTFPKANIVPLIIKSNTKTTDLDNLISTLQKENENLLFIASVDFSHYQPANLAQLHDDFTISALNNLDINNILLAETDSPEVLNVALSWAKLEKTEKFSLFANTNSGFLSNNFDVESTTHVMGLYEKGNKSTSEQSFSLTFGGDMMFDRGIEYFFQGEKLMDVMKNLGERTFWGTDLKIVNLEGPISSVPREPDYNHSLVFNFPPKTIDVLKWMHLNAVSLANNHTLNNGQKGLSYTVDLLKKNDIAPIGQDARVDADSIKEFSGNGIKASIITIDTLNTDLDLNLIKTEKKKGNKVVIYPHWGNEYEQTHSQAQENLAESWIDAGADLIIGSHPHVVQDIEIYKNVPIVYSLGNLLFDQYFSPETQQGLIVAGKFTADKLELIVLPTIQKDTKPQLQTGTAKQKVLDTILKDIDQNEKIKIEYDKMTISY